METTQTEPHRIKCAEIWGGILTLDSGIVTPGLSASIFSTAHDGDRGGDMYYVSVCKWDYLTRIALADLRGHGGQVSRLSIWVYEEMQKRMNTLAGNKILASLNDEVKTRGFSAITTAVVIGYHTKKKKLYFSYAGHPPAYVQRKGEAWQALLLQDSTSEPTNLPLGILSGAKYDMAEMRLNPGDRLCLYTDGVTECANSKEEFYGEQRLADVLNRNRDLQLDELKMAVLSDLAAHRGELPPDDDVTLVVAELT